MCRVDPIEEEGEEGGGVLNAFPVFSSDRPLATHVMVKTQMSTVRAARVR